MENGFGIRGDITMKGPAREKLDGGAVKATLLQAHLGWYLEQPFGSREALEERVEEEARGFVARRLLATEWVPFRILVGIDEAIADLAGEPAETIYHQLGHHSAVINLAGVYKAFVAEEPHRFFEQMALLHSRFQDFGRSVYRREGERSVAIRIEEAAVFSRVFCGSSLGYYEGALEMMKVPGPISTRESLCCCYGDEACQFELSW